MSHNNKDTGLPTPQAIFNSAVYLTPVITPGLLGMKPTRYIVVPNGDLYDVYLLTIEADGSITNRNYFDVIGKVELGMAVEYAERNHQHDAEKYDALSESFPY